jgi:HAD superfamily hydrolase (TIGR01509 family)
LGASKGLSLDIPLLRSQKAQRYRELVESVLQPMDGALALLARVFEKKRLALASSAYQVDVERVLNRLGIIHYFEVIASGNSVERGKPFPDIFLYTAQQLQVEPSQCVVLEDAEKGVVAARQAGMKCIAVPNKYTQNNDFSSATKVVSSLREITVAFLDTLD